MTNVEHLPATREPEKRELETGGAVRPIVPQSMEDAYRIGVAVCKAGMAPKDMNSPEKCLVAIMQGMEVGMTPMQSLQRIAVINGRPTIWGDGAIGLVRASGRCEYIKETIAGKDDAMVATCEAKRKGEAEPIIGTFSVADAKKAGLWDKSGPWKQFPKRMLQMRARAFALRDGFADVLGGMYLREELEDEREMKDVTPAQQQASRAPSPPPAPPEPETTAEPAETVDPETGEVTEAESADTITDPDAYLEDLEARLCGIKDGDTDSFIEMRDEFDNCRDKLFPPDAEKAEGLFRKHEERLSP